jgi:hypothetical protein
MTEGMEDTYEVPPILAYIATALPRMENHLETQKNTQDISFIEQICKRFHLVAKQLQGRHQNRETLAINDEYDV